ncbi:MAG: TetR/AcrR family transcriptional regulator, partial [Pseudolysinimonas sp.]
MPSVRDYQEPRRARALSVEDRQDMIIGAVTPLVLELGKDVTSRQIAEAAGIAEGTIFRAFGDKETLLNAVVERYLDPLALRTALRSIDPDLSLEEKLSTIFGLLQDRFKGIIRMMAALGRTGPPPRRDGRQDFAEIIAELLDEHSAQLRLPPERVAHFARVLAFASALPVFDDTIPFTFDELVDLFEHGVIAP